MGYLPYQLVQDFFCQQLQDIVLQMCVSNLLEKHVVDALDDAEPLVWVLKEYK